MLLGLTLALGHTAACETASSKVDGSDLRGVFDPDAGTPAVAPGSGAPTASALPIPGSAAPATSASVRAPTAPRAPGGEGCVESGGGARTDVRRTIGRPACRGADILEWRDPAGAPRYACLHAAPGAARGPLPLLVFLHGDGPTVDSPTAVTKQTGLRALQGGTRIGDSSSPGFHVLAVQGRALAGENTASFDASTGADNLDVVAIDHFVAAIEARGMVDRRRVYAVGLGPGGTMAATWAMLRADRVAAFAAFSSPPPEARWVCPGPPPPAVVMYRACDAIVACEDVESWLGAREAARARTVALRLGDDTREVLHCETRNSCGKKRGTAAHARWPKGLEKRLLESLGEHALALPGAAR